LANILCIGTADATMATRRMILERAGHSVTEAVDLRQVIAACESRNFEVAVLSQTLPDKEKARVSDTIIRMYDAKILELHTGVAPELLSADAHLQMTTSAPEGFLECVNALASQPKARGA